MLNSNINKTLEINSNKAVLLSIKKQWLEKNSEWRKDY